jgi:hypothetical protein
MAAMGSFASEASGAGGRRMSAPPHYRPINFKASVRAGRQTECTREPRLIARKPLVRYSACLRSTWRARRNGAAASWDAAIAAVNGELDSAAARKARTQEVRGLVICQTRTCAARAARGT